MTGPGPADRRAGFTLVELLVSMAVLSLVALTMVAGLRFVVQAVASTDNRREGLEELTLGLSVLRGELERAQPLMVKVGNRELVMFSGMADRLRTHDAIRILNDVVLNQVLVRVDRGTGDADSRALQDLAR